MLFRLTELRTFSFSSSARFRPSKRISKLSRSSDLALLAVPTEGSALEAAEKGRLRRPRLPQGE